jgi:DNA-binding MarR family transcriptional regulator
MDVERAVAEFLELYPAAYLRFYRRRNPRAYRPRPETLALLEHLASTGPLTVEEAARHFDRSQSSTSEIVTRLIARGFVDRIADVRNRRRHLIWLTEKGREIVALERQVLSRELVERAMSRLSSADREKLVRGLQALVNNSSAQAAGAKRKGRGR